MRARNMLLASAAAVIIQGGVAMAQGAPVEFASDPGAAHPKYVDEALATGADARNTQNLTIEAMMASQPALETVDAQQVMQSGVTYAPASDNGAFDYGYALNEVALAEQNRRAATTAPTALEPNKGQSGVARMAMQTTGSPYQQDPIYQITENASATQASTMQGEYVRVQPGDTVYGLSRRFGVKANTIIAANRMNAPYTLEVGQVLLIPGLGQPEMTRVQYTQPQPAPRNVTVANNVPASSGQVYIVRPGNTLYSISRAYGLDVGTVAAVNGMAPPYTLSVGQRLVIPSSSQVARQQVQPVSPRSVPAQPVNRNTYIEPNAATPQYQREAMATPTDPTQSVSYAVPGKLGDSRFSWPIQGQVVMGFGLGTDGRRNDGINIAAPIGTPIRAVEDGEVVYRGSDLEGYGNLLLVKHTGGWVSAYAHTDAMLVRKGEKVRQGQVIAKVGTTGTVDQPQLHFELRHDLKPTDPLAALEGRNALAIQ